MKTTKGARFAAVFFLPLLAVLPPAATAEPKTFTYTFPGTYDNGDPFDADEVRSTRLYCDNINSPAAIFDIVGGELSADGDITQELPNDTNQNCYGTFTTCRNSVDFTDSSDNDCAAPNIVIETDPSNIVAVVVGSPTVPPDPPDPPDQSTRKPSPPGAFSVEP